MTNKEKKKYKDQKKQNDNWFEKAKKIKKVNLLSVFIQKTIQTAKDEKKPIPTIKDIAPLWKSLSNKEKDKYREYAEEINEERYKLKDLYDISHGVKPKKAAGAYRIFLQEKAKLNEFKNLQEVYEMWKKLSESEKDEYLKKSHKCQLAYKYKIMIYNKKVKKLLPHKPGSALCQFLKEKKGQKPPNGEKFMKYWPKVYSALNEEEKKKYEVKAEKLLEEYNNKKMVEFKDKVFDMPKRPKTGYNCYISERMNVLRKEKPDVSIRELFKQISEEWNDPKKVDQEPYLQKGEKERKIFRKRIRQFEKYGYYTTSQEDKSNEDEKEEDEKEDEKSSLAKTSVKSSQKKKKISRVSSQKSKKGKSTKGSSTISKSNGSKDNNVGA